MHQPASSASFPALNARPEEQLEDWLIEITAALAEWDAAHPERQAAPYAVNQIVHRSNERLMHDLELCVKYRVPIVITSLGARRGRQRGRAFLWRHRAARRHQRQFARKAIEKGADGLIAVAAGAGGHAGTLSPFALVQEIRDWFDGPLSLSGAIATGARHPGGAGLRRGPRLYRLGLHRHRGGQRARRLQAGDRRRPRRGHRLHQPVHRRARQLPAPQHRRRRAGPGQSAEGDVSTMNFDEGATKAWKDIWGSGQGIGAVKEVVPAAELVARLTREYAEELADLRRVSRPGRPAAPDLG